jgi:hypothetical protein
MFGTGGGRELRKPSSDGMFRTRGGGELRKPSSDGKFHPDMAFQTY